MLLREDFPHLVNSWHSYLRILDDENSIFIPVGGMNVTEKNVAKNENVLLTVGNKNVEGHNGMGTGFLIEGKAEFLKSGKKYELVKDKFPWARAALQVKVEKTTQTL